MNEQGSFLATLNKLDRVITKTAQVICAAILVALVVTVFLAVIFRYVFFSPLNFANMLSKYLVMWLAFLGAGLAVKEGEHVSVEALTRHFSNAARKKVLLVVDIVVSTFLIVIAYYGFIFAWNARGFSDPLVWDMSMMYAYLSVPVGFVFILIQYNLFTVKNMLSEGKIKTTEEKIEESI